MRFALASALVFLYSAVYAVELSGTIVQGGLLFGQAEPGSRIRYLGGEEGIEDFLMQLFGDTSARVFHLYGHHTVPAAALGSLGPPIVGFSG